MEKRTRAWNYDEQDRLVLFRIPQKVGKLSTAVLSFTTKEWPPNSGVMAQVDLGLASSGNVKTNPALNDDGQVLPDAATTAIRAPGRGSMTKLPAEVVHAIAEYLHPIDRVCVALTCKNLARAMVSAPRLTEQTWRPFASPFGKRPVANTLVIRLAHGWLPKDKMRYCCECDKILPRDETYFRKRLAYKKRPGWLREVDCSKQDWDKMSTKAKYEHLVRIWCSSKAADSSGLFCETCRGENFAPGCYEGGNVVACPLYLEEGLTSDGLRSPTRLGKIYNSAKLGRRAIIWILDHAFCLLLCCSTAINSVCDQCRRCWRAIRWNDVRQ
ncbi:hypothetical protein ABEF95_001801 [Exophiala dermatitidis]|uniref:F-box domain-containing protein n=1 Tax=Exophiala dermatitidis (strain ATCC 34100 / CBS 525.76 / NIH/UT8656) TaxID=858893 RepID=H6BKD2_EXODN|nr:uncharacterized protein HMPREF1120_00777 [Exophiala dermatitidis NIH/UT8656]EHY52566.1 hypothetical protein HMPREF1120_00777 [Exophiala dermatitidis NIH/UT8656]